MENCKGFITLVSLDDKLVKDDGNNKVYSTIYRILVLILLHLSVTRHNIMDVVILVAMFMQHTRKTHFNAAKRMLRYVNGTCVIHIFFLFCTFRLIVLTWLETHIVIG
jgi:hypothetical protein